MLNSSIWPIRHTLSVAATPGYGVPGSDGNKEVLRIPQSSGIIGASPSDCFMPYPGHSLMGGGSYLSAEKQSVYSSSPSRLY